MDNIGGNPTAKQIQIARQLAANPRQPGEGKTAWCKRVAKEAQVSWAYVMTIVTQEEYVAIGRALRAKEAAEEKVTRVYVDSEALGPVQNFRGWPDFFSKVKVLCEAYLRLSRDRNDVYATAFLEDIKDTAERAHVRAEGSAYKQL